MSLSNDAALFDIAVIQHYDMNKLLELPSQQVKDYEACGIMKRDIQDHFSCDHVLA